MYAKIGKNVPALTENRRFRTIGRFFRGFYGKTAAKIETLMQYNESINQSKAAKIANHRENREFFTKIANLRENRQKLCR